MKYHVTLCIDANDIHEADRIAEGISDSEMVPLVEVIGVPGHDDE